MSFKVVEIFFFIIQEFQFANIIKWLNLWGISLDWMVNTFLVRESDIRKISTSSLSSSTFQVGWDSKCSNRSTSEEILKKKKKVFLVFVLQTWLKKKKTGWNVNFNLSDGQRCVNDTLSTAFERGTDMSANSQLFFTFIQGHYLVRKKNREELLAFIRPSSSHDVGQNQKVFLLFLNFRREVPFMI